MKKKELNFNSHKIKKTNNSLMLFFMCLPMLFNLFIFNYIPMGGIIVAFKNFNYAKGFLYSDWVGLKNFRLFFINPDSFRIFRNTLGYNLVFLTVGLACNVGIALLLNEIRNKKALKFYQTIMFFPYFMSWVVIAYIVYALLNTRMGIINNLFDINVDWYNTARAWPGIIIISNIWKNIGYGSIIYYAAIIGIDTSYYEAAKIEGATKWHQITKITLPELYPLMVIMTILGIGAIFTSDFGLFYQLTMDSKMLYPTTDVLDTYVFRALMKDGNIGISSAAGVFKSIIGFILVNITNYIVGKVDDSYALY